MLIQTSILATLLAISAAAAKLDNLVLHSADQSLLKFIQRSSPLTQQNPQRSLECFDYYVPILNGIADAYKVSYQRCLDQADESRHEIDESTQPDREHIESAASNACDILSSCNSNVNSIDYFECYANGGSENSKTMFSISANSSEILSELREQYRLVVIEENRCTNKSERAYVEDTAAAYEELQSCIQGKTSVPPSSPPPSSEPPSSEPPSSEPPSSEPPSTEPPSSEPPSSEPPSSEPPSSEPPSSEPPITDPTESIPPETTEPSGTEVPAFNRGSLRGRKFN